MWTAGLKNNNNNLFLLSDSASVIGAVRSKKESEIFIRLGGEQRRAAVRSF